MTEKCEFAEEEQFISLGRKCTLDNGYCENWDKPLLVASCPTRKRSVCQA